MNNIETVLIFRMLNLNIDPRPLVTTQTAIIATKIVLIASIGAGLEA